MNLLYFALAYALCAIVAIVSPRVSYILSSAVSLALLFNSPNFFTVILSLVWIFTGLWSVNNRSKKDALLYSAIIFSIVIILASKSVFTFLAGWELMTIFAFFSIKNWKSTYKFLAFGEISTIFLLLGFSVALATGVSFSNLYRSFAYPIIFLLCSIGFMAKMEIFPFHIWAPSAYRDAPTNISVLMSSCMTLMGVYGIVYLLSQSPPPEWIAVIMLLLGAVTSVYGALQAATSENAKELLAYSTIENDGIILVLLATFAIASKYSKILSAFAITAVLFYAFFHSLSKALMLLSAGSAEKEKVSTLTALAGYVASLSLAAIPPLPGFTAEWMALETLFQSFDLHTPIKLLIVLVGALVALSAGICAVSMSKMAIYVFKRKSVKSSMYSLPLLILSAVIVSIGIYPPAVIKLSSPLVLEISGLKATSFLGGLLAIPKGLLIISGKGFGCISPTVLAAFLLSISIAIGAISKLTFSSVRMCEPWTGGEKSENYDSAGYSMILRLTLRLFYGTEEDKCLVKWYDLTDRFYASACRSFSDLCDEFRVKLMNGNIGYYVLYILVAMVAVLIYSILA